MPKSGWWIAAVLLLIFWSSHSPMVRGYWFGGWWRTVMHRPLGDWHLIDVTPFIGVYVAVHLVMIFVDFLREVEIEEESRGQSDREVK